MLTVMLGMHDFLFVFSNFVFDLAFNILQVLWYFLIVIFVFLFQLMMICSSIHFFGLILGMLSLDFIFLFLLWLSRR